ncbi:PTS-dependent dihydroxyacetone kinase operon regulatory domain protein, partial [Escherichia coli EPECa14]
MKRETWNVPHQAQGVTFASIYRRKKAMLTLGQAALEDAWEYMAPRECALFILDETACILSRNGDPQTLQQLSALGFNDGTYCAEGIIGTCALSLAAISGQAVKTMADQHFKQALWNWAFCATPLFDSKGRLTGTIALACPVEQTTAADLPLTLAIAREVGNLLLTDSLLAETNRHLNQLNALLESMDDGVISWDEQGNLQFINAQAARVLRLDATASQGRAITELLTLPAVLQQAIKQAHPLKHVEATFESQHQFIDAVITLKPIIETQGTSFILLLHPVEQMRQLMTSQLGKVSHTFAHMPQDDPQTRRLIHFGRQAARSSFPVLLCGEEGVGKALLSQAIHNESERAAGPYIAVNCELYGDAALAEEFIGGDRTDNENGRLSRLELAHGGTLFLEKIEYLAVELQSA